MPDRRFVRRLILCGSLCLAAGLAPLLASSPQQPIDRATVQMANLPKGTGLVMGQVIDALTNQPIPEAIVTMNGRAAGPTAAAGGAPGAPGAARPAPAAAPIEVQAGRRGGAADPAAAQAAALAATMAARGNGIPREMTGPDGRFVFHDLPKGQFQFNATAPGYISGVAGQTRPSGPSQPMALDDGQHMTDLKIRLWKYATISGLVVDDSGEPAVSVNVQAMRRLVVNGRMQLTNQGSDSTDDRGVFRITSLSPGDYVIVVPQTVTTMPAAIAESMISGLASGNGAGGAMLLDLASSEGGMTNPMGQRVGDLIVSSRGSNDEAGFVVNTGADGRLSTFQTMFYPSVTAASQATTVTVKSGEERAGANIQLRLVPTARVSGTLMGPMGPSTNTTLRLSAASDDAGDSSIDVATAITRGDGTFTFLGVPPGQFVIRAQKSPRPSLPAELSSIPMMQMMFGDALSGGRGQTAVTLYAQANVGVGATDVNGLALTLAEGAKISGHLEFDGNSTPMAAPQLQSMTVTLMSADGRSSSGGLGVGLPPGQTPPGRVGGDGQFQTSGYAPGRYVVMIAQGRGGGAAPGGGATWIPKSATLSGHDVMREALDLTDHDLDGVVITFTDKISQLSGVVHDATGALAAAGTAYLVPTDFRTTVGVGSSPKRLRAVAISKTGTFSFGGLVSGEYFVAAVADNDLNMSEDPSYYDALARLASRVTVSDGEQKTFDLKIVKVDR